MHNPIKLGSNALDGAKVIYGAIKQLKGKNTSNTRGLIRRIIRDIQAGARTQEGRCRRAWARP